MKFPIARTYLVLLAILIANTNSSSQVEREKILDTSKPTIDFQRDRINADEAKEPKSDLAPCSFPSLLNGKSFPTGANPMDVASGDLNNDGKPDVVTADFDGNSISILIGDGSGGFQPSVTLSLDARPRFVTLKDLNNDGNLDAVVLLNGPNYRVVVFLGNGTGNLSFSSQYSLADPSDVKIGDVNNDGKYDLLVKAGDSAIAKVYVYPGNGDATFGSPIITNLPGFSTVSIEAGDFNGDGKLDFISSTTSNILLWVGNGTGTFSQSWASNQANGDVYKGNFNGDPFPDLVVMNTTFRYVKIFAGNSNGTFSPLQRYTIGEVAVDVAVGDLNHDGLDDIVTSNFASNEISVLINIGSAAFSPKTNYVASDQARGIVMNDFNGDGNLDVVTTGGRSIVPSRLGYAMVISGRGNGTFNSGINYPLFTDAFPNSAVISDLDGDGRSDVITGNSQQFGVSVLLRNGSFKFAPVRNFLSGTYIYYVDVNDFNGDGKKDIVAVGDYTGYALLGDGTGNFSLSGTFATGTEGGFSIFVGSADFNLDGKIDLVVSDRDHSRALILFGHGDGTFAERVEYIINGGLRRIAIADLNHDNLPDLVAAVDSGGSPPSGKVQIRLNQGGGIFSTGTDYFIGTSLHPTSVIAKDFNRDGNTDFAVIIMTDSSGLFPELEVYQGNGSGNFGSPVSYDVLGINPSDLVANDFNQDGNLDLAIVSNTSEDISVFSGGLAGNFTLQQTISAGEQARAIATGDLNSDSSPEIIATNYNGSSFTIVPNTCNQAVQFANLSARIVQPDGRPVKNAIVSITDPDGVTKSIAVGPYGNFTFGNLITDSDYTITVISRRFHFDPRIVRVNGNLTIPDFFGSQ